MSTCFTSSCLSAYVSLLVRITVCVPVYVCVGVHVCVYMCLPHGGKSYRIQIRATVVIPRIKPLWSIQFAFVTWIQIGNFFSRVKSTQVPPSLNPSAFPAHKKSSRDDVTPSYIWQRPSVVALVLFLRHCQPWRGGLRELSCADQHRLSFSDRYCLLIFTSGVCPTFARCDSRWNTAMLICKAILATNAAGTADQRGFLFPLWLTSVPQKQLENQIIIHWQRMVLTWCGELACSRNDAASQASSQGIAVSEMQWNREDLGEDASPRRIWSSSLAIVVSGGHRTLTVLVTLIQAFSLAPVFSEQKGQTVTNY